VSPGVDGAVKLKGEGEREGAAFGKGGVPTRFDGSIKSEKEGERETKEQYRRPALAVEEMMSAMST